MIIEAELASAGMCHPEAEPKDLDLLKKRGNDRDIE